MNYDFFASRLDKIKLLDFIFEETDLRIFDVYSPPGIHISGMVAKNAPDFGKILSRIWIERTIGIGEMNKTSRKVKYMIHEKWSVKRIGSLGVMPGADLLDQQGVKMGYFIRES